MGVSYVPVNGKSGRRPIAFMNPVLQFAGRSILLDFVELVRKGEFYLPGDQGVFPILRALGFVPKLGGVNVSPVRKAGTLNINGFVLQPKTEGLVQTLVAHTLTVFDIAG